MGQSAVRVLNAEEVTGSDVFLGDLSASEIARKMNQTIIGIFSKFVSEDGSEVDYEGFRHSTAYDHWVKTTALLRKIDVFILSKNEKIAFFINIYNALQIHSTVVAALTGPCANVREYISQCAYQIGSFCFTKTEIEHGILRANRRPPYKLFPPFSLTDPRRSIALTDKEFDPRIHFALNCGARSCPVVRVYLPEKVDEHLTKASFSFCEENVNINVNTREIALSKIFYWYFYDFGESELLILKWILRFLSPEKSSALAGLLESRDFVVTYPEYNWTLNGKL